MGIQEAPGFAIAFVMGLLSFFSPCVLPLIPGYISFMSGVSLSELEKEAGEGESRLKTLMPVILSSLAFIVGLGVVYMSLGVLGALAVEAMKAGEGDWARTMATIKPKLTFAGGLLVVALGIHMTGVFRIKSLYQEKRIQSGKGGTLPRAFLLGIAFAFGWAPCTGPIIASIWMYAATGDSALRSVVLLALYTLGLAIPIFITGIATRQFFSVFDRVKMHFHKIEIGSGVLLIIVGLLMMFPGLMGPVKDLFYYLLPDRFGTLG